MKQMKQFFLKDESPTLGLSMNILHVGDKLKIT